MLKVINYNFENEFNLFHLKKKNIVRQFCQILMQYSKYSNYMQLK